MRAIWFKLTKVYGERFKDPEKESVNLNSDFNLGDFTADESFNRKSPVFEFNFTYTLDFEGFAQIQFKGSVYIEVDDKKIVKELENKKVDNELKKLILDYVLSKTHVDSLNLEEKLGLPFHVSAPRVSISTNQ